MSTLDITSVKGQHESNDEDERIELTLKEYQEFTAKLQAEVLLKHLPTIHALGDKIFTFKGLSLNSENPQVQ